MRNLQIIINSEWEMLILTVPSFLLVSLRCYIDWFDLNFSVFTKQKIIMIVNFFETYILFIYFPVIKYEYSKHAFS